MAKQKTLTPKQELFAVKFVECGNATEAYRHAYNCKNLKPTSVNRLAKANTDNVKIASRIAEIQEETAHKLLVSEESVLREYTRVGFSDVRRFFDSKGKLLKVKDLDEDTARAVSSFKVVSRPGPKKTIEYVSEIKLWPKLGALEAIGKNLGLFDGDGNRNEKETFDCEVIVRSKVV